MNEFELYSKYFKPEMVAYDIGAHIGEHSIHLARMGAKWVYAFEPSDRNFDELLNNTRGFKVTSYQVGLNTESYSCVTRFKDCSEVRKHIPQDGEQVIHYIILEEFIKKCKLPTPDFIKMDIEGMESLVLNTFEFLFIGARPIVLVEIHVAEKDAGIQDYKNNPHWRYISDGGFDFNKLKDHNYIMLDNNCNEIVGDYNPIPKSHGHRLLIPKEKL